MSRGGGLPAVLALLLGAAAPAPELVAPPIDQEPIPEVALKLSPARFLYQGKFLQGGLVLGTAPPGTIAVTLDGAPVRITPDGRFVIAFGRDHAPTAMLVASLADGTSVSEMLQIGKREWDIQSIPRLPKGTTPTPEFLARRKIELEQINAARRINADSNGWQQRFLWPATGRISGVFGSQRIYAGEPGAPHAGVDIARPSGTPVASPADGVVVLAAAAPFTLEGNLLIIDHGMGVNSAFLHLSRIDVKTGDRVTRGQLVGAIGATGRATGPHLHWAMKWQDERIDPALLAGAMP